LDPDPTAAEGWGGEADGGVMQSTASGRCGGALAVVRVVEHAAERRDNMQPSLVKMATTRASVEREGGARE
jgi:hypothetical protein